MILDTFHRKFHNKFIDRKWEKVGETLRSKWQDVARAG